MTAQALRMPFAYVPNAADLLSDEHLAERGFFETVETAAGNVKLPGAPFKMSETPLRAGSPPRLGEDDGELVAGMPGDAKVIEERRAR